MNPDEDMKSLALSSLEYANSYYKTVGKCLAVEHSRFDNNLLYQMTVICVEKYFVALLAFFDCPASHHAPLALYKEAKNFVPELDENIKQTVILVGKFEAICVLDGFGYHTPSFDELSAMHQGIAEIKTLVEERAKERNLPSHTIS
jgi:hypothetical protein